MADPGQPPYITAPGILVSMRAAANLKLKVYYCRHLKSTSSVVRSSDIARPNLKVVKTVCEEEYVHSDPTDKLSIDSTNWSKTLEAIHE